MPETPDHRVELRALAAIGDMSAIAGQQEHLGVHQPRKRCPASCAILPPMGRAPRDRPHVDALPSGKSLPGMATSPTIRRGKGNTSGSAYATERAELQAVLSSQSFQRAPSLSRILTYICNEYFNGQAEQVKEYSIAVEALGRGNDFDPQADSIVRVDLHLLRKRLQDYYASEGASHRIQIELPRGSYTPEFLRVEGADSQESDGGLPAALPETGQSLLLPVSTAEAAESLWRRLNRPRLGWLAAGAIAVCGVAAGVFSAVGVHRYAQPGLAVLAGAPAGGASLAAEILHHFNWGAPDALDQAIRIRCGANQPYKDSAGFTWLPDRDFTGGTAFHRPLPRVARSQDPQLYSWGREGVFRYAIPVRPGSYELHLFFAESKPGIRDAQRDDSFTIGGGPAVSLDVVSDAGGVRTAAEKVYPNIHPGTDGRIHISFWSLQAFVNAIEIMPQTDKLPNPVRVIAQPTLFTDTGGRHWLPDRYYRGGRETAAMFPNGASAGLFSREHYGNFSYAIPVAAGYRYQVTLYMAEHYWGPENSGLGGVGSRVFDVRCNGLDLLRNFDLYKTQGKANGVAIRFRDLRPNAQGKLMLRFLPVVNYPLVNAIQVQAE